MTGRTLELTLLDDAVFSRRGATAGGHEGLDYVPGAALLGAAAARLYARLDPDQAFLVFHSGRVRFGNALPLTDDGERALPMPLCWHGAKSGLPTVEACRIVRGRARNFIHGRFEDPTVQPRQLREGYVTRDGRVLRPRRRLRLKTAIDPERGRAGDGQLFGYQALAAGQRFLGRLDADPEVPAALLDRVIEALTGELRLGRSRSAEYGRVQCNPVDTPLEQPAAPDGSDVTLWLLSDLALQDPWGQPTLYPDPELLGLGAGELDLEHSFLRTRSYAPFNGKWARHDLERPVLVQGSVLRYRLATPPDAGTRERLASGVGLHRQAGLGRVWVDPPLLAASDPADAFAEPAPAAAVAAPEAPDHPLVQWLWERAGTRDARRDDLDTANRLAAQIPALYETARRLSATEGGPGGAQWERVVELACRPDLDDDALRRRLFTAQDAVCRSGDEDWGTETLCDGERLTFGEWLQRAADTEGVRDLHYMLRTLARQGRDAVRHREES